MYTCRTCYTVPVVFFVFCPTSQHTLLGRGRDSVAQHILCMLLPSALCWPKVSQCAVLASLLPWEGPQARGTTPSFEATPWAVQGSLSGTQPALSHPRPARTKSALCCTPSPRLFMAALCLLFENKQTDCLVHRAALSYSKGLFVQVLQEPGSVFQQQTERIMP